MLPKLLATESHEVIDKVGWEKVRMLEGGVGWKLHVLETWHATEQSCRPKHSDTYEAS